MFFIKNVLIFNLMLPILGIDMTVLLLHLIF